MLSRSTNDQNQGRIFLAGPPLVKAATGEIVDEETLGGGEMHTSVSGVADYLAQNDGHAIRLAREAVRDLGTRKGSRNSVSVDYRCFNFELIAYSLRSVRFDHRYTRLLIWMLSSLPILDRATILER